MEDKIKSILAYWQSKNALDFIFNDTVQVKHASPELDIYSLSFETSSGLKLTKVIPGEDGEEWKIIRMK